MTADVRLCGAATTHLPRVGRLEHPEPGQEDSRAGIQRNDGAALCRVVAAGKPMCYYLDCLARMRTPMHEWQLQDAKNRFSELVRRARDEGPQTVTVHGRPAAVMLSADAYAALAHPRPSFADYLLSGPAWPDDLVELINDRGRDAGRAVEL